MPKPAPPFPCVGHGDKAHAIFWNLLWDLLTRSTNQPPRLLAATELRWARGWLERWGREVSAQPESGGGSGPGLLAEDGDCSSKLLQACTATLSGG